MMLPDLEVAIDFLLFLAVAIKVDPQYHRLEMAVYADEIHDPNIVVIRTELMHFHLDRETPRGAPPSDRLIREMLGLVEPHPDPRPRMKIITWNCQGVGKRAFGIHCLSLRLTYNPRIMVVMETRVSKRRAERIIPTLN